MCGRRREGRTSGINIASEVCMDKGMCKSQTAGSPGFVKMKAEKRMGNSVLHTLLVLPKMCL